MSSLACLIFKSKPYSLKRLTSDSLKSLVLNFINPKNLNGIKKKVKDSETDNGIDFRFSLLISYLVFSSVHFHFILQPILGF